VHELVGDAARGDESEHVGVGATADIVDQPGFGIERGGSDARSGGVDADQSAGLGHCGHDRQHPPQPLASASIRVPARLAS